MHTPTVSRCVPGLYLTGQDSLFVGVVSALMSGVLTAVAHVFPSYHPLCTALMSGVLTAMRVSYLAGSTLTFCSLQPNPNPTNPNWPGARQLPGGAALPARDRAELTRDRAELSHMCMCMSCACAE